MRFRQTIYLFKEINPSKKFSQFTCTDLRWDEVNVGYCNKQEVIRIDGRFFMYSGEIHNDWDEKQPPLIRFKSRTKLVKEVLA